ncbi:MAG: lipopolysaccharide biosynthesis protein [Crocinitomicaceae bacterium]|jgi:uncharacterized protein involved in exopolysaccharide biosynthesis|nr:lipopolysaccharide biosynthesis protein [Crocinitomicaceae bacterium]
MKAKNDIQSFLGKIKDFVRLLLDYKKTVIVFVLLGCALGVAASFMSKRTYSSKLSFILDDDKGQSALTSLANTFLIGSSNSSGLFNISGMIDYLQTRTVVEKALLTPVKSSKQSYAQLYIENGGLKDFAKEHKLVYKVNEPREKFSREKDSLLGVIFKELEKEIKIEQPNIESSIISIKMKSQSELFSKEFPEALLDVAAEDYTKTKTSKIAKNVNTMQHQADSVRNELNRALMSAAVKSDDVFGLNPAFNSRRVPSTKSQIDVQANTAILTELVKNLEISKLDLLNQTPLIQIIDRPILPLENKKMGKVKGFVIGGVLAFILVSVLLIVLKNLKTEEKK